MVIHLRNIHPKPQTPWSLIVGIILFLVASFMLYGCAEPKPWERLGHHEPITGKLHGSVSK